MRMGLCAVSAVLCFFAGMASGLMAAETTAGKGFPVRPAGGSPAAATGAGTAAAAAPAVSPVSSPAPAVVSAPPAPSTRDFENQPILFANPERRPQRSGGGYSMPSVWPAVLSVLVVCAIFGGILYVMKKYIPGHRQLFSHPSMEILGRAHLDQKRYVSLLRVGKRILVVGVSADDMQPLSEIVEEEEVTAIMEVARPKTENGLTIFQKLFQRNVIEADAAETKALAEEEARQLHEDMTKLRQRVQGVVRKEVPAAASRHVDRVG